MEKKEMDRIISKLEDASEEKRAEILSSLTEEERKPILIMLDLRATAMDVSARARKDMYERMKYQKIEEKGIIHRY